MKLLLLIGLMAVGMAHAGGLTDSLSLGDRKALDGHDFAGTGQTEVLKAHIGTVNESIPCFASSPKSGAMFRVTVKKAANQPCTVQITEAYPPDSPGIRYTYGVYADGKLIYVRDYPAIMFGPVSYFVRLDDPAVIAADRVTVKFVNYRDGTSFRIAHIWAYSDFTSYCESAGFDTPFYIAPLLDEYRDDPAKTEAEFEYLSSNLRPIRNSDVKLGCSQEIYYMNRGADYYRAHVRDLLRLSRKYNMPFALSFVSWWGGTPMRQPDGKGGVFSDVEYQQICWSETDAYDDGEPLRKLLGDKYDLRYGLTVPNRWSSVPWLTMNHPVLNAAKHKAIAEKLGVLKEVMAEDSGGYLLGIAMENEPRYWHNQLPDDKYPVKRENLMADFNPVTVADAAKDGVTLDPSDGLDYKERIWLHENGARYQQETYDAHARTMRGLGIPCATDALWHNVYSHSFPRNGYPMEEVTDYHPLLEWNRLNGCRTGIEYDFRDNLSPAAWADVTREWGRWSQVNYEENNGIGKDRHLRALRACYAYGCRFYNFYNWQSIDQADRWREYVRTFCADKPRMMVFDRPAGDSTDYARGSRHEFTAEVPTDWATINEVNLTVDTPGEYTLTIFESAEKTRTLGFRRVTVTETGRLRFDLPNCIPTDKFSRPYFVVEGDGRDFGMLKDKEGDLVVSLYSDSRRERTQSLLICWRADAESLIRELRARHAPDLDAAGKLFAEGKYVRAYEEALRIEKHTL